MVGVLNGGREGGPCVCLEEREKISRDSATLFLDMGGPAYPAGTASPVSSDMPSSTACHLRRTVGVCILVSTVQSSEHVLRTVSHALNSQRAARGPHLVEQGQASPPGVGRGEVLPRGVGRIRAHV